MVTTLGFVSWLSVLLHVQVCLSVLYITLVLCSPDTGILIVVALGVAIGVVVGVLLLVSVLSCMRRR
jgi:hypothetical protein